MLGTKAGSKQFYNSPRGQRLTARQAAWGKTLDMWASKSSNKILTQVTSGVVSSMCPLAFREICNVRKINLLK